MLPYLIAGAIGFVVAKIFEEDEAPKYADGGELLSDEMEKHISNLNELLKNDNAGSLKFAIKSIDDVISTETSSIDLQEYKTLQKEIKKNGVVPILIDESNSTIIDGNHRWKLLNKMGIKNIPVFELKANDNFWENDDLYMEFDYQYKNETPLISINEFYADGGSVLLAPNGKPSNLTPEQYKLVREPAFIQWFGDWENSPETASKVVDENGEPKVMYRGNYKTQKELGYTFNLGHNFLGKTLPNNFGFFFTDDIEVAKKYGGRITSVFLKANKVFDFSDLGLYVIPQTFISYLENNVSFDGYENLKQKMIETDYDNESGFFSNSYDYFDLFPELRNLFKDKGFDSVCFQELSRSYFPYLTYAVFEPNQIKLADGSNTTFDGNNPDIRFDDGGIIISNEYSTDSYDFGNVGNAIIQNGIEVGQIQYDINTNNSISIYLLETLQKGIGAKVINYFFADGVNIIYGDAVDSFDFWKKMGAKFDEFNEDINGYPFTISKEDFMQTKYFKNPDIRFMAGGSVEELKFSNEIESDAMGYDIGDYLYHITPVSNFNTIINKGFIPKNGISINGKPFENRLYFATSLISAYDLSVNFGSYRDDAEYVIFKIKSDCIDDYEEDDLFAHGIYVDYKISNKCILGYVNANDLFNKFNDEDIENLYY